jgi:hypothetical protein
MWLFCLNAFVLILFLTDNQVNVVNVIKHVIFQISANMEVTQKTFAFPQKHNIPLYYVSASDGTNVVKVQ